MIQKVHDIDAFDVPIGGMAEKPHDDRVDFLKLLPSKQRNAILPILAQAERNDIYALTAHEEGTAGAIMTTEYAQR